MSEKDPYLEELDASLEGLPEEDIIEEKVAPVPKPASQPPPRPSPKAAPPPSSGKQGRGAIADDIPLRLVAVLGKKTMTVKDVLKLKAGQVIELERGPEDAVDLFIGGKLAAKGELVDVEGQLGVRILSLTKK